MKKLTKRSKKRLNKTFKKGGASKETENSPSEITIPESKTKERQGLLDFIGNKITNGASSVATTLGDTGLRLVGLERVDKAEEDEQEALENENKTILPSMVNDKINKISDAASGVVSDFTNFANKTGANIIENVNDILGNENVKENIQQAAENTAEILKDNAEIFNEAINKPEVKEAVEEAINNASDVASVAVKAAEKPFNSAIDVLSQTIPRAAASSLAGVVKVGTDTLAAVPGFGAIIDFGKMVNDGTRAISGVVEATSDAVEAGSDLIINTKENFEKGMKLLEKNKQMAEEISNRTNDSIKDFENPLNKNKDTTGGGKTRRKFSKHKAKSKRVRFSI